MSRRVDPDTGELLDDDDDQYYGESDYGGFSYDTPNDTFGEWDRYDLEGDPDALADFLDGLDPDAEVFINAEGDIDADYHGSDPDAPPPSYGWLNVLASTKADLASGRVDLSAFANIDHFSVYVIPPERQ
jgi:hypothetical protein